MSTSPRFDSDPVRLAQPFPADFAWGFAASAYQIEGAAGEDGRGPSIWDTFARQPGAIADGSTGDIACDHYHRYPEDVRLMADLGARSYRFSVSWSRVLPNGTGVTNERGLDFYQRLVDALLGSGVQPLVNLSHWDLPQVLQDRGGFADPQVVGWFTDYAALLASKLGDRVKDWMTFNWTKNPQAHRTCRSVPNGRCRREAAHASRQYWGSDGNRDRARYRNAA